MTPIEQAKVAALRKAFDGFGVPHWMVTDEMMLELDRLSDDTKVSDEEWDASKDALADEMVSRFKLYARN